MSDDPKASEVRVCDEIAEVVAGVTINGKPWSMSALMAILDDAAAKVEARPAQMRSQYWEEEGRKIDECRGERETCR